LRNHHIRLSSKFCGQQPCKIFLRPVALAAVAAFLLSKYFFFLLSLFVLILSPPFNKENAQEQSWANMLRLKADHRIFF
jgi:hypothetical protein